MAGQAISMDALSAQSSQWQRQQSGALPASALPQHSRIVSHLTGLGSAGGVSSAVGATAGGGQGHQTSSRGGGAGAAAPPAGGVVGGPRGRMMLAAAVEAQSKARLREELEAAKRMTFLVGEASKRAREESAVGGDDGDATAGGPLRSVHRSELPPPQQPPPETARQHLLAVGSAAGVPSVPTSFFVRKGDASTAAAQSALRQQALQKVGGNAAAGAAASSSAGERQAAALGLAPGVRVLTPSQAVKAGAIGVASTGGSRAFAPLAGSGGSATFISGASAAKGAQRSMVEAAGGSAFVANALAMAAGAKGLQAAGSASAKSVDIVAAAKQTASRHSAALSAAEFDARVESVDKIVRAEKAIAALDAVFEVPGVPCGYCDDCGVYFSSSAVLGACTRDGHAVRRTTATRRFYECAICEQFRIAVLERPSDTDVGGQKQSARKAIDRDCGVCKRMGLWRRCSAAPATKRQTEENESF